MTADPRFKPLSTSRVLETRREIFMGVLFIGARIAVGPNHDFYRGAA